MSPFGNVNPGSRSLNVHFFDEIDTEEKAYWLGFISADAYLSRLQVQIQLKAEDSDHLLAFLRAVKSDSPLGLTGTRARVSVSSIDMVRALNRLGVGTAKTFTIRPWEGPTHLMRHYWRGQFDGDGGIEIRGGSQYGYWRLSFTGNKAMADGFANFANGIIESVQRPSPMASVWQYHVSGRPICRQLIAILYDDATIALERKHELALRLLSTPVGESSHRWRMENGVAPDGPVSTSPTDGQIPLRLIP